MKCDRARELGRWILTWTSTWALSLVDDAALLAAACDAAMDDEQHQFVHAKLPVHSQYDRDRL